MSAMHSANMAAVKHAIEKLSNSPAGVILKKRLGKEHSTHGLPVPWQATVR